MRQEADAEAKRRRLYRPGASPADLADYLHSAAVDEPATGPGTAVLRRRRRPWPIAAGAAAVLCAAVLGGTALSASLASRATPSPTASALAAPVGTRDRFTERVPAVAMADSGARRGAAGQARSTLRGRYLYTVAPGDSVTTVASRFGLCTGDVLTALPYGVDPGALPRGLVLLLDRLSGTPREYDGAGVC